PEECIDCDACREECPVEAIKSGDEADPAWAKKNAEFQFTEDKRRTSKDQVQHGPKWEESRARK
ncbi:MAG: 4Fe-4S binding protein, partial [Verrucomicrobiae bacterium]|nr:4Fe-4S binding protein [Verrucomicrobiae bacterium]